jgi:predicted nucleic acid-binding protein
VVWYAPLRWSWRSYGAGRPKLSNADFVRAHGRNHPIFIPTEKTWLKSGQLLAKIHAVKGFTPEKLRDLHFDVLIALTARSNGARLITSNRADFELIHHHRKFRLEIW